MSFKDILLPRFGLLVALVLLWTVVSNFGLVDPIFLPSPQSVAAALRALVQDGNLLTDLWVSLRRVCSAILIATVVGVPVGLFFGYRPRIYAWVEHPLNALRSIPATCLFPLILIVIGVGEASIVTLATYPCLLIMLVSSATGASLAEKSRIRQAQSLGAGHWRIVKDVLFFEALPHITAALRTCVSYALVLIVAVEMFIGVGEYGLGRKIFDMQSNFQIPETYAGILVTGALGVVINFIVNAIESFALRWLPQAERQSR